MDFSKSRNKLRVHEEHEDLLNGTLREESHYSVGYQLISKNSWSQDGKLVYQEFTVPALDVGAGPNPNRAELTNGKLRPIVLYN